MPALPSSTFEACSTFYDQASDAYQAGHFDNAAAALERVFALNATHAAGLHLRGLVAFASNDAASAQHWIARGLDVQPHAVFYNSLCVVQTHLHAFADAAQSARRGLELQPDAPLLHYNLGLALQLQGSLEEAAASYRRTLELAPDHSAACNNLGTVLKALDDLDGAQRHYRRAAELDPANTEARSNLGHVLLAMGRYEEAWPFFENRWAGVRPRDELQRIERPELPMPQWKGHATAASSRLAERDAEPVHGRRLLVVAEQGYGDSLQFARYLPMALERFAQVGFVCPPPLRRLFDESLASRAPGLTLFDALPEDIEQWDWHSPLLSLPMAFGTRLDTIPAQIPYLYAEPSRSARWRARLADEARAGLPRVGLVWAGGNTGWSADGMRSLAPAQMAPLLALTHLCWVSLQKADDPAKRADMSGAANLIDWMDEVADFADTAALIDNLDLVITADTSVAHLAGAMGKPVWLMNRFAGCWRWLRGRDDSPWYPGMRIFTQRTRGEWADVLAAIVSALNEEPFGRLAGEEPVC
jgi:tetratricopeptide (TPR) repeat protein